GHRLVGVVARPAVHRPLRDARVDGERLEEVPQRVASKGPSRPVGIPSDTATRWNSSSSRFTLSACPPSGYFQLGAIVNTHCRRVPFTPSSKGRRRSWIGTFRD